MALPLGTKETVNLAVSGGIRVSRIRRDPPPIAKKTSDRPREDRDRIAVIVGVLSVAVAIFAAVMLVGIYYGGWTPAKVVLHFHPR